MTRQLPMALKVYQFDETSTQISELMQFDEITELRHSTRIPGGFWTLSFVKAMRLEEYWRWREKRRWYRIVLEQVSGRTLWEGRFEIIDGPVQRPKLTFRGYWSNFTDSISDAGNYGLGGANTRSYTTQSADAILKDILDNGFDADAFQLSADQSNIAATGVNLTLDYDTFDKAHLNHWQVLTDPNFGVLSFPDSNDNIVDLQVLEDREVHLSARNPSSVNWRAFLNGPDAGIKRLPMRVNFRNVAKSVGVIQQLDTRTNFEDYTIGTFADDSTFDNTIDIKREYVVPALKDSPATTADTKRDGELAARKDPQQEVDDFRITKVFDNMGIEQPICNIRAGDVLQVPDLIPNVTDLSGADLDALSIFVIEEATCDHSTGEVIIRPDRQSKSLSAILARGRLG